MVFGMSLAQRFMLIGIKNLREKMFWKCRKTLYNRIFDHSVGSTLTIAAVPRYVASLGGNALHFFDFWSFCAFHLFLQTNFLAEKPSRLVGYNLAL